MNCNHARTLDHWGITKFGKYEYKESIEEMRHADAVIQRILFLDGLPNVQRLNNVMIGQSPEEILRCDLRLEEKAIADLRDGIAYCEQVRDFPTRDLIDRTGIQNWVQLNSEAAGGEH